jgi:diguanylate cyclase (GGDEF)-like protein
MAVLDLTPDPAPGLKAASVPSAGDPAAHADEVERLNDVIGLLLRKLAEARIDKTTGLPDRADFIEQAETLLRDPQNVYVLFLDLCEFKPINDTYGHLVGDVVLKAQAARLRAWCEQLGGFGVVGRYGGDEFVAAVRLDDPNTLGTEVSALRAGLASPVVYNGTALSAPASIGLAEAGPGRSLNALLQVADLAMLQVKKAGRPVRRFEIGA